MRIQLYTERLCVRTLPSDYTETVADYLQRNYDFFQPWMPVLPNDFTSMERIERILNEQWWAMMQKRMLRFFFFHKSDKSFQYILGDSTYSNIVRGAFQSCFVGYKVDHRMNGQGLATEALRASNSYLFEQWNLHRIEANIMPSNQASQRVVRKLGFEAEGLAKNFLQINGQWEDHLRFALTKEDWEQL